MQVGLDLEVVANAAALLAGVVNRGISWGRGGWPRSALVPTAVDQRLNQMGPLAPVDGEEPGRLRRVHHDPIRDRQSIACRQAELGMEQVLHANFLWELRPSEPVVDATIDRNSQECISEGFGARLRRDGIQGCFSSGRSLVVIPLGANQAEGFRGRNASRESAPSGVHVSQKCSKLLGRAGVTALLLDDLGSLKGGGQVVARIPVLCLDPWYAMLATRVGVGV